MVPGGRQARMNVRDGCETSVPGTVLYVGKQRFVVQDPSVVAWRRQGGSRDSVGGGVRGQCRRVHV